MEEIPNQLELTIHTPADDFVRIISQNTTNGVVIYPTHYLFTGKIDSRYFQIFRLKKFATFDYSATAFTGTISSMGSITKINAEFSLIWIYKHIVLIIAIAFTIVEAILINTVGLDFQSGGFILFFEMLGLLQLSFQNERRFKKDKQRYLEMLTSLFGKVEVKTPDKNL